MFSLHIHIFQHTKNTIMSENASAAASAAAAVSEASAATNASASAESANAEQGAQEATAAENTQTKRDTWRERYKKRFAPEADEIDTESDDYYDNLNRMADEYDRMEGNERQMNDLLASNPSFEGMIRNAKEGKSFLPSLIEAVGVDKLKEALEDPSIAEEVGEAYDKFMQRSQQEANDSNESQQNIETSISDISAYAEENNLSPEQVNDVIIKMTDWGRDAMKGLFSREMIDAAFKAMNYDSAVNNAMETGRVQGRNENIQAQLERSSDNTELPPNIGQSGTLPTERKENKRKLVMPLTGEEVEY